MTKRTADALCEAETGETMHERFDMLQMCNLRMLKQGRRSLPRSVMQTVAYLISEPMSTACDGTVESVAFSPGGALVALAASSRSVSIMDTRTGDTSVVRRTYNNTTAVAFSPDLSTAVSGTDNSKLQMWGVKTRDRVIWTANCDVCARTIVFSHDGAVIAVGGIIGVLQLWNAKIGACQKTFIGHGGSVTAVSFSPDDKTIASASADDTVRLWNVNTGTCTATLTGHIMWVLAVAFSPDGNLIISGSVNDTLRLWDTRTHKCIMTLTGQGGWVHSVKFSPDGATIASGSSDGTVRLWDTGTGVCTTVFKSRCTWPRAVAFSPDGLTVALGMEHGTTVLLDVATGLLRRTWSKYRIVQRVKSEETGKKRIK